MEMILLANADMWTRRFTALLVFVVLPVALVSPAVWARKRRNEAVLAALIVGTFVSGKLFLSMLEDAIRSRPPGEMVHWLAWVMLPLYAALLGTGLIGVWRWFWLPRR